MVSILTLSTVDRVFEPRLGQTKDCKISIWLAQNQYNVSKRSDMSIRRLLFQ